jgi:hypothetical protein
MNDAIAVEVAITVDGELVEAMARLVPQLSNVYRYSSGSEG